VRAITLRLPRIAPKDLLDHVAHSLGARTESSHLPPVTKAKAKAVRERGDATGHQVDWFRRSNVFPLGHQAPPPPVGEHHPREATVAGPVS
jgi:hypothetical protein